MFPLPLWGKKINIFVIGIAIGKPAEPTGSNIIWGAKGATHARRVEKTYTLRVGKLSIQSLLHWWKVSASKEISKFIQVMTTELTLKIP